MTRSKLALLAVCLLLSGVPAAEEKLLYLYNWSEYLPETLLDRFEHETGIRVVYTTYESNEAMYAKLRLLDHRNSYDLVVPSTYYVSKMRREGLLKKIDRDRLQHFANLDARLLDQPFDPDNTYSIPYLWGSTGIAVNTDTVAPGTVSRWRDLWRPEFRERLLLTNDMREVFHVGLRVLGHSGNTTDPAHIEAAYRELKKLVPNVRAYNSEAPRMPYLEGETDAGMIWNGEAYMARQENPAITYVYPGEGAILWMDSLVIPATARHVAAAHRFIDFVLRPEIAAQISAEIGYASPNRAGVERLDAKVRNDRSVYPTAADLKHAEFQTDVGEAIIVYQKFWERLKTGRN